METTTEFVGSSSGALAPTEVGMLKADVVQEILARLARGEGVKRVARELSVDRKTVKAWRRRGAWRARTSAPRAAPPRAGTRPRRPSTERASRPRARRRACRLGR